MKSIVPVVLSLVVLSACQHASSAAAPGLQGKLSQLDFYVGDWTCHGEEYGESGEVKAKFEATVRVRPVAQRAWLQINYDSSDGSHTLEFKGFDTAKNQWTHVWAASDGTWGSITSQGFMGNSLTFPTIQVDAQGHHIQTVFTKLGPTAFSHGDEAVVGESTRPIWKKTCTKV
jgi:Protein of unknown function (DUF1579)